MSAETSTLDEKPQKRLRPRRWLRRVGWTALIVVGLLGLFHRPLIFRGTKLLAVRLAKEQKLALEYDIEGTIFTTLRIQHLKAKPLEPGPVERLEIAELRLRYSFLEVARHGLPALLKDVEAHDAWVVLDPAVSVPRPKRPGKRTKFPAIFPERLKLTNFNLTVRSPAADTELGGLDLDLDPAKAGVLRMGVLEIPTVRRWTNITARTAVRDREFSLEDLTLAPEIVLRKVSLDGSELEKNRLGLELDLELFAGTASVQATIEDLNQTNRLKLEAEMDQVPLGEFGRSLELNLPIDGSISRLKLDYAGVLNQPAGWRGGGEIALSGLSYAKADLGSIELRIMLGSGRVTVAASGRRGEGNRVILNGEAELPSRLEGFIKSTARGRIEVASADLAGLTRGTTKPLAGDLGAQIDVALANGHGSADIALSAGRLAMRDWELTNPKGTVHVSGDLEAMRRGPLVGTLTARAQVDATSIRWRGYQADNPGLSLAVTEGVATLDRLELTKGRNVARVSGRYTLPTELTNWDTRPLGGKIEIEAPDLGAFVEEGSDLKLAGALKLGGEFGVANRSYTGRVATSVRDLQFNGFLIREAEAELHLSDGLAHLQKLQVTLDDRNHLAATGTVGIDQPYAYSGTLSATFPTLSLLEPAMREFKRTESLAGSLVASWQGEGELQPAQHSGTGTIELEGGQFGENRDLAAHLTAEYSPHAFHVPQGRLAAGAYEARGTIDWSEGIARLTDLAVSRNKLRLLEGQAELPLNLTHGMSLEQLVPEDGPVNVTLRSNALNLTNLFSEIGRKQPPISGIVSLDLTAQGSLRDLTATGTFRGTHLQATAARTLAPARATLELDLRNRRLTGKGLIQQPRIAPIEISASMPLDVAEIRRRRAIDPNSPLEARMRIPRSSLELVPTLVPKVRTVKGTLGVDFRLGGTVNSPELSGSTEGHIAYLRFVDSSLPPMHETSFDLGFTHREAIIRRLAGRVAGGSFQAAGKVSFQRLTEPVFDIRLGTSNALLWQNDTLTARANSNLAFTGPLKTATLSGTVALTQSRFLKDVEILPIGLPGRPAPKPPPKPAGVSFPNPPLRDWKFDVAVRTADPFLIQGNLANGRALIDLKLRGTGLTPWLEGDVRTEALMTSLPFSRLEVTSGRASFSAANPFQPSLEVRATSTVRDYRIEVYIFGSPSEPQAIFTSQPPLPQSDIVSLLATGTTTRELSEDPNILAGRAAALLFQKLYHKFFRKNEPLLPEKSLFSQVQFDMGAVDPKSGRESLAVRVPLTDEVVVTGGVDVGGDFRGQVKYLVRFR